MTTNNVSFLSVMLATSFLVSGYQLPLIENTLNKYGYENNLNERITFSKSLQQFVEDQKIGFSSYINGESENNEVVSPIRVASAVSVPNNIQKTNVVETQTVVNDNSQLNQGLPQSNPSANTLPTESVSKKSTSCMENCTILMLGDSVMGDVDFSLQRLVKKSSPNWKVIDGHKVSSGLTNQTYYDWPATAKKLVEKYKPDYVFILLGTNDAQGIMVNGKGVPFNKDIWVTEYANRVSKITEIMESTKASWYWIGLPVTKDNGFNSRLQVIRNIQSQQTKKHYLPVETIFGKNDHSEPINMKLRAVDGIHLNSSGSDLVAKELMTKLKE